jgi:hypothetical protein
MTITDNALTATGIQSTSREMRAKRMTAADG